MNIEVVSKTVITLETRDEREQFLRAFRVAAVLTNPAMRTSEICDLLEGAGLDSTADIQQLRDILTRVIESL